MGISINHRHGAVVIRKPVKTKCQGQPVTSALPSNCWSGETCFIIGGGPSLAGFDWSLLDKYKVISINKSFMDYPAAAVNFGMDYRFFEILQYSSDPQNPHYKLFQAWKVFPGVKLFVRQDTTSQFVPGIHYVNPLAQKAISMDLAQGIYPGNNSGLGALMLAVGLGCKRIGLLGYDFKIQGTKTHYHDGYQYQAVDSLQKHLPGFCRCVDEWAAGYAGLGIEVVNLSSDSALQNYLRQDIHTFLEATSV